MHNMRVTNAQIEACDGAHDGELKFKNSATKFASAPGVGFW